MIEEIPIPEPQKRLQSFIESPPPELLAVLAEISRDAAAAARPLTGERLVSAETAVLRDLSIAIYGPYEDATT